MILFGLFFYSSYLPTAVVMTTVEELETAVGAAKKQRSGFIFHKATSFYFLIFSRYATSLSISIFFILSFSLSSAIY